MATLHGTWHLSSPQTSGFLFLWADTWLGEMPTTEQGEHPFALDGEALQGFYATLNLPSLGRWVPGQISLRLPSHRHQKIPVPFVTGQPTTEATYLHWRSWMVPGFVLTPGQAVTLIQGLPLDFNPGLGAEFNVYGQLYRWALDLLWRGKYLPSLQGSGTGEEAVWWPVLDSIPDQTRLAQLVQGFPPVALAGDGGAVGVLDCLQQFLQAYLVQTRPPFPPQKISWLQEWLTALVQSPGTPLGGEGNWQRLGTALHHWYLPVQTYLAHRDNGDLAQRQWRGAVQLLPPADPQEGIWRLAYGLQALDDDTVWVPAQALWEAETEPLMWQGRRIDQGQESLLRGLGLGAGVCESIAHSLAERCPTGCEFDAITAYTFIKAIAPQLRDRGLGVRLPAGLDGGGKAQRLGIQVRGQVTPKPGQRLTLTSLIQYDVQLAIGDAEGTLGARPLTPGEFEGLLAQQSPLVALDGEWITLQPAEVRAAKALLQSSQDLLPLRVEDALRLSVGEQQTLGKLPVTHFQATGLLQELIDTFTHPQGAKPITNPPGFRGQLRPYQERGVGWLAFLERWGLGACLADDMGLGKTAQLLAFLLHLRSQKELTQPVLIVCPTSVLSNWAREIEKFAPDLQMFLHHGDRRKKGQPLVKQVQKYQIVLTSYALLQRDGSSLRLVPWRGVVLDEAQNIKNPQAKQAQVARSLTAGFRIALTGTPLENRLLELWSILEFLNPGFLGNQTYFKQRFANPIEKFGDRQSLAILKNLVRLFILRRLKTDPTILPDLPTKQEMTVYCGLSRHQATLYETLVNQSLETLDDSSGIQRQGQILALLTHLKQLCNHPDLFLKKDTLTDPHQSGKLLRLEEMLEEVITEGDRALIFTQFAQWGHLLKPYLEQRFNQEVLYLHGGIPQSQRQRLIDRFQQDPHSPPLFILSLKAGGTGLNLTRANHVFHVDRWWNPAVENQATDRAFRLGQTRHVQVHKFVCTGTLEEKIDALLADKRQLTEQTLETGENWLARLDTDKLRQLLLLDPASVMDD